MRKVSVTKTGTITKIELSPITPDMERTRSHHVNAERDFPLLDKAFIRPIKDKKVVVLYTEKLGYENTVALSQALKKFDGEYRIFPSGQINPLMGDMPLLRGSHSVVILAEHTETILRHLYNAAAPSQSGFDASGKKFFYERPIITHALYDAVTTALNEKEEAPKPPAKKHSFNKGKGHGPR